MANASIRSASTYAPAVATSTHVINTPAGAAAGDILAIFAIWPSNSGIPAITPPTGWTEHIEFSVLATNQFGLYCATRRVDGTEGSTLTFTGSLSDRPVATVICIKDTDAVSWSGYTYDTADGTAYTGPSSTPSVNNSLILAMFGSFAGGASTLSYTAGGGSFTEYSDTENPNNHCAVEVQQYLQAVAASISATATASVAAGRSGTALVFDPPITPVNSVAPALTTDGSPAVGETISVDTGTWTHYPTSYTYQWKRDGSSIGGATSSSYTLVTADAGAVVKCTVTAANAAGSANADSNTATVAALMRGAGPAAIIASIYAGRR